MAVVFTQNRFLFFFGGFGVYFFKINQKLLWEKMRKKASLARRHRNNGLIFHCFDYSHCKKVLEFWGQNGDKIKEKQDQLFGKRLNWLFCNSVFQKVLCKLKKSQHGRG